MKSAIHVISQPNIIPSTISRVSNGHVLCFTVLIAALLLVTATGYAGDGDNIKKLSRDKALPLLDSSQNGEAKRFIIRLKQRHRSKRGRMARGDKKGEAIARLKQEVQSNQEKVLQLLSERKLYHKGNRRGNRYNRSAMSPPAMQSPRSFWLSNCIAVTATPEEIEQIAGHPDVAEVTENVILSVPTMDINESNDDLAPEFSWNQRLIGLDAIFASGLDGRDVRVGIIDTGINPLHPDIAGKITTWAEFDSFGNKIDSAPHESHKKEHGTHVASILAGNTTGVAPGVSLTVALALPKGFGRLEQLLAAMQWVLNPDNDAATNDGAQIVNMSWGLWPSSTVLREAILNMVEAGVLPVCAIGNVGEWATFSPGNVPEALGVGAVDKNDIVPWFSSWGEVHWDDISLLKPDISAPGEQVPTMDSQGNMVTLSGTSIAAPHVAGAGALLLQHTPELTLNQLRAFLLRSAKDLGPPKSDYYTSYEYTYGKSRLDVAAALDFLEQYSPGLNSSDVVVEAINPLDDSQAPIVYQYFSDGKGGFSKPVLLHVPGNSNTELIGLADVNGDGYSDLIARETKSLDTGEFRITYTAYPSEDASGFSTRGLTWYSFVSPTQGPPELIGFGDVNGDQQEDMILAQSTLSPPYYQWQMLAVLAGERFDLENPPELWSEIKVHRVYTTHFSLGDINGDSRSDLIVGLRYQYYNKPTFYSFRLSDGERFDASYNTYPKRINASFYGPLRLLAVKDVNGDGWTDMILGADFFRSGWETPVYVALSNGRGSFFTEKIWATLPLESGGRIETASDMNDDGLTDIIIRRSDMALTLDIWLSNGENRFVKKQTQWLNLESIPTDMDVGFKGAADIGLGDWRR